MPFSHLQYVKNDLTAIYNPHTRQFVWNRWNAAAEAYQPTGTTEGLPGIGDACWPIYADLLAEHGNDYPIDDLLYWYPVDPDMWRIYLTHEDSPFKWSNPLTVISPSGEELLPASVIATDTVDGKTHMSQSVAFPPSTIPYPVREACRIIFASLER